MMKRLMLIFCCVLVAAVANAQTLGTKPSETSDSMDAVGRVTEYTPGSSLVLDIGTGDPVHYKIAKSVHFVDTDGKNMETPDITTNARVRIHYNRVGADMVVDQIALQK